MIEIENSQLEINQDKVSILYFSMKQCQPCKILKPVMTEISEEMKDGVDVYYVDIEKNQKISGENTIMSVPTLIFMKDDKIQYRIVGLQPKTNIVHAINNIK
jgi:thioredoxin 1